MKIYIHTSPQLSSANILARIYHLFTLLKKIKLKLCIQIRSTQYRESNQCKKVQKCKQKKMKIDLKFTGQK